jgi:hypothetical protein
LTAALLAAISSAVPSGGIRQHAALDYLDGVEQDEPSVVLAEATAERQRVEELDEPLQR